MKRLLQVFLPLLLLPIASAAFSDVGKDYAYFDGITYLERAGVVQGYEDGTFRPAATVNRAEFMKLLFEPRTTEEERSECVFEELPSDVELDAWYAPYVCIGYSLDVVQGYTDGTFRPANTLSFSELAKILVNGLALWDGPLAGDPWYEPYVRALEDYRAIPTAVIRFDQLVTRELVAEMLYRTLANVRHLPYSTYEVIVSEGEDELLTCTAYWEGFVPDFATETCVFHGSSDCSSPYTYTVRSACEDAFDF